MLNRRRAVYFAAVLRFSDCSANKIAHLLHQKVTAYIFATRQSQYVFYLTLLQKRASVYYV